MSTTTASGASLFRASTAVAGRTTRKFLRTPQLIVVGTIQGAMFLLIFRYVFGGAIHSGIASYVDFLVPGFVTTSVLFGGTATAAGVAEDLEQGFIDRLRSLPIPRASVLTGRALADTAALAWSLAITVALGFAVGFRLHGSVVAGFAALGLCVVYSFAFSWPATSMPGWLQAFAKHQPVTPMVDAVRELCLGQSAGHDIISSLLWSIGLVVVFAPIAVARFRRA